MTDDIAIRVEGLGKCYHVYDRPQDRFWQFLWRGRRHFHREFWALREVNFEVRRGETVGIIGRNGSGKSTLLQLIAGTLEPTTGRVDLHGRVAALLELGSGFNPEFTGRENVFLNASILGLSQAEIEDKFEEIAAFADIGEFIDRPVKTYSSGMIVRLAFSVSVCVEPEILIVDEALSVGDMVFQFKCMERLDRLTQSGVTLLFVSHDIAAVKAFCRRAVYLVNGEVRNIGPASDMTELYLMDMRAEQKDALSAAAQIKLKPALIGDGLAFGTSQGRVRAAKFMSTGGIHGVFSTGERVRLLVEVEYDHTVSKPSVTILLYDHRMVEISGRYFYVQPSTPAMGQTRRATAEISFPATLNNGKYYLTLRLEDRISDTYFSPIDKQVAALSFQVMRPMQRHFLGMVDLDFDCAGFVNHGGSE